jgi:hypothetical protein
MCRKGFLLVKLPRTLAVKLNFKDAETGIATPVRISWEFHPLSRAKRP